ncbi:hypothetical protein V5799_001306 [Amblyomma americanum]|uniref:Uncharacterized protein n=1 Tax=Amblyomma americanum TaxID=6943 RepID=A0AAQ4D0K0_AMBAM
MLSNLCSIIVNLCACNICFEQMIENCIITCIPARVTILSCHGTRPSFIKHSGEVPHARQTVTASSPGSFYDVAFPVLMISETRWAVCRSRLRRTQQEVVQYNT